MDVLQLQDVFQPYYAGRPGRLPPSDVPIDEPPAPREAVGGYREEMRKRLENCRATLASAIAADSGR